MRGTSCAETFSVVTFSVKAVLSEALSDEALSLLDETTSFFAGQVWWDVVLAHAVPAGAKPLFVTVQSAERIAVLLPMLRNAGRLSSLTTPYTCDYVPTIAAGLDAVSRVAALATFGRFCRPLGIVRLDALPAEWEGLADLEAGIRQAGLRMLRFDHFGNWYEDVAGLDWPAYLLGRTGALRETIKRRLRRAEKLADARFELMNLPIQMDLATAAFESVYRRSWKEAEPYPMFNVALMRALATIGLLRFGVWSIGDEPVAVQVWVVKNRQAIVLKLAHDEAFKAFSPGTVLTALMLRHLLDQEHVVRIDFGRGDDPYKRGWATTRRQRIGVLLVNPWRVSGMVELLRHGIGRARGALRKLRSPN